MIQSIIVYIIGFLVLAYVAYKVVGIFRRKGKHICGGCPLSEQCGKAKAQVDSCGSSGRPEPK